MALLKCDCKKNYPNYCKNIKELGIKWRNDPMNPVNSQGVKNSAKKWDSFIKNWVLNQNIPLLIRKKDNELGTINLHKDGRKLIPVDNSPAQWVFASICNGFSPPTNIIVDLENGIIPVAMVLPKLKPGTEAYRGKLSNCPNTQKYDWYLAHKINVGLHKKMYECTLGELENHFYNLMSPLNMFVVPKNKTMRGLAELVDFIEQQ